MIHNSLETELSNVPTDELWNELRTRYNNALLIYTKESEKDEKVTFNNFLKWGAWSELIGLVQFADIALKNDLIKAFNETGIDL